MKTTSNLSQHWQYLKGFPKWDFFVVVTLNFFNPGEYRKKVQRGNYSAAAEAILRRARRNARAEAKALKRERQKRQKIKDKG
jgi:hypothetical protein